MSSKTRRKKWLIGLLAASVVVAGAAFVGLKLLSRMRVDGWEREGIAAAKAGDYPRAADLLARYIQRRPGGDIQALEWFVVSREKAELPNGQHLAQTIAALKLLLGRDPDRVDDRRHLLELYVKLERWPEALDTANAILGPEKSPKSKDPRILELKTQALMGLHQYNDALAVAQQTTQDNPLDLKAQMARLALRAKLGHPPEKILEDAQELREHHPGDARFEFLQGYACAQIEGEEHEKLAREWLETAARHSDVTDDLAMLLIEQFDRLGLAEDSIDLLQNRVKNGAGPDIRHALARRFWQQGKWQSVLDNLPDVDPADVHADATLLAFKAIALANLDKKTDSDACRSALAGRPEAAARAWVLLLRRIVDAAAIDDKQAISECREALFTDPKNTYLAYYLGDSNARLGETDGAVAAWFRALPYRESWLLPNNRLVEALLQKGRPQDAMWVASMAARGGKITVGSAINLARAYAAGMDIGGNASDGKLAELVSAVQAALPGEEQTLLIQVQLLARQADTNGAANLLRSAVGKSPVPDERFLLEAAGISRRLKLGVEAECYSRSEQAHGATAALAYYEALDDLAASAQPSPDAALARFDEIAKRSPKSDDVSWKLSRARLQDVSGDPKAKAAWFALGDGYPQDLRVQQAAATAAAVQGDWDFMQRTVERLHKLTGDTALGWQLAQARLMVDFPRADRTDADIQQGAVLLQKLVETNPSSTDVRVLLAGALVRMNRVDGAIEQLTLANQLDRTSVPIALELASLLQSRGDFERVQQELDQVSPFIRSAQQRHEAALLLARQSNSTEAVKILEGPTTRPGQPRDSGQDDLLLAMLYRREHQLDKAEAVAQRLLEKPDLATVQFAASLYASQGRRADAEKVLGKLDAMRLEPGIKELAWGSYYAETGDVAEAVKRYQEATRLAPSNAAAWRIRAASEIGLGRIEDALTTIDQAVHAIPADDGLALLKRESAVLANAANDPGLRSVVMSIVKNPVKRDADIELLQTVDEGKRSGDMERFAARLQQFVERHPDSLTAQIQLADCEWAMGRRSEAVATGQHAISAFPSDPEPARFTAQLCAASGNWDQMLAAAEVWKKRAFTGRSEPDVAIAAADIGLKDYSAAQAQLEPYLPAAKADPDHNADLLTTYATTLVNSGRVPDADALLWPLADRAPKWHLPWLQVALQIPDDSLAAQSIDRLSSILTDDAVMDRVAVAEACEALGNRLHDQNLIAKSSALFSRIASTPGVPAAALVGAGSHAERLGDATTAEACYRHALELDPKQWVAANNLAMLIVRHGGDLAEAQRLAAAAVKLRPQLATTLDTLGQIQAKARDYPAAAATLRAATQLEPDNLKWRVRLAQCLLDGGNIVDARKAVQAIDDRRLDARASTAADQQAIHDQLDALRKRVKAGV